jgi:DnaJ-class molecular chaperone
MQDLYGTLGVPPSASSGDIRKAYLRLAVQHHPDKGGNEEDFKRIGDAYNILIDDDKRKQYDGAGAGADPFAMFDRMFRGMGMGMGMGMQPQQAQVRHVVNITLEEAFRGVHKQVDVASVRECKACMAECSVCRGRGRLLHAFAGNFMEVQCSACAGSGHSRKPALSTSQCTTCNGSCKIVSTNVIDFDIPRGVHTGMCIQVQIQDLLVSVVVEITPHSLFDRSGDDLTSLVNLTFEEAFLGKQVEIMHFDEKIQIDTRDLGIVVDGQTHRLVNRGMPVFQSQHKSGSLIVKLVVSRPRESRLSDVAQIAFANAFALL